MPAPIEHVALYYRRELLHSVRSTARDMGCTASSAHDLRVCYDRFKSIMDKHFA